MGHLHLHCSNLFLEGSMIENEAAEPTPRRRRFPLTAFSSNCWDGAAWMKSPSVTGKKAQVPNSPDIDTVALAFCRTTVSAFTRQSKTADSVVLEAPLQPAALANVW